MKPKLGLRVAHSGEMELGTMYLPTAVQQLAIQARLNFMLGVGEYDRLFIDFACGEIRGQSVQVFARSEHNADEIAQHYAAHVAIAIESIVKRPIRSVKVLPRNYSDTQT
jgi:hypothetical protein